MKMRSWTNPKLWKIQMTWDSVGKVLIIVGLSLFSSSLNGFTSPPVLGFGEKTANLMMMQCTTFSCEQDGGAFCGAAVGGKCMASKGKLVLYAVADGGRDRY